MRTARRLIILFFILFSLEANAQIVNEIISYVDSNEVIVNNGRKFLLNRLSVNDRDKSKEIYQYLTDYTSNKKYAAFDYTENISINLLLGDWDTLTACMQNYQKIVGRAVNPKNEQISDVLHERISRSSDSLLRVCQQSDLDTESKKVIQILLHLIKVGTPDYQYNQLLKAYHKEYKKSAYNDFVYSYLPPMKIRSSLSFSLGSGMIVPTNKLDNFFSSDPPVYLSMDINYKKLFTSLYVNTSALKLKTPFLVLNEDKSTTYNKDDAFSYYDAGVKIGYFFIRSDRFHIAPAITIGGAGLESDIYGYSNMPDAEFKVLNSFIVGPAIHTEIKLFEYKTTDVFGIIHNKYISLKLEGGYNYMTKTDYPEFKGNAAYVTMALVWGTGYF